MAVIESIPGVEVHVITNDQPLIEYTDPDVGQLSNTASCFVEAKSDQNFEIQCMLRHDTKFEGDGINFHVCIDGAWVESLVVPSDCCVASDYKLLFRGARVKDSAYSPFYFSDLKFSTDDKFRADQMTKYKQMGVIEVQLHHIKYIRSSKAQVPFTGKPRNGSQIIPEKATKGRAVSHSVSFGPAVAGPKLHTPTIKNVDPNNIPQGRFYFQYRSLAAFKSMLIIPRTPPPEPLELRDPKTFSVEDIAELQRRINSRSVSATAAIKEEGQGDRSTSRKRPRQNSYLHSSSQRDDDVRETPAEEIPRKRREVTVIDLT